ncbi:hypothetical protein E5288_WYG010656 [Bos mutus]|uniref:Uncharacterized protein n=1 Tax=Bos mutus TaxID=72004 RepID=A0A6B0S0B1_9CETA|nr:hypothetical protein [Bos mutus]
MRWQRVDESLLVVMYEIRFKRGPTCTESGSCDFVWLRLPGFVRFFSVDYHRAEMTASQDEEESNYSSIFMSAPVNLIKLIGGKQCNVIEEGPQIHHNISAGKLDLSLMRGCVPRT